MPNAVRTPAQPIRSYRDLVTWQKAVELCAQVYRLCRRLPRSETFGLGDQMRRATVSVASNIAEGHGRHHLPEYLHYLSIARGSLAELETQIIVGEAVDYFTSREVAPLLEQVAEVGRS